MSLLDQVSVLPNPLAPVSPPLRLEEVVAGIRAAFPDFGAVKPVELKVLVARMVQALERWAWDDLTEGHVATIAQAMAAGAVTLPLSVESFLMQELAQSTRKTLLGAVCEGFLHGWELDGQRTRRFSQLMIERAAWLPSRWQRLFQAVPEVLDTEWGARRFGQWLAAAPDPYRAVLAKGIAAPHAMGFMAHVHTAWLAALPPMKDEAAARRVLAWIIPRDAPVLDGDRGAEVVARLLEPWRKEIAPENLRAFLVPALTAAYGDPRKERPEFWALVGDEGRRVMLRWVAGRSMEAFIEVVSRAEARGEHREQWASRRRFWMGMYERGRIDEAWVAFTKEAKTIADELFRQTDDPAFAAYGLQNGSRKDTCLLVMRIGRNIVVEGSHNFRVHMFDVERSRAPRLYERSYDPENFLLPVGDTNARMHDPSGNWMGWVRDKVQ